MSVRLTKARLSEVQELYETGASAKEIAGVTGLTAKLIRTLIDTGLPPDNSYCSFAVDPLKSAGETAIAVVEDTDEDIEPPKQEEHVVEEEEDPLMRNLIEAIESSMTDTVQSFKISGSNTLSLRISGYKMARGLSSISTIFETVASELAMDLKTGKVTLVDKLTTLREMAKLAKDVLNLTDTVSEMEERMLAKAPEIRKLVKSGNTGTISSEDADHFIQQTTAYALADMPINDLEDIGEYVEEGPPEREINEDDVLDMEPEDEDQDEEPADLPVEKSLKPSAGDEPINWEDYE